MNIFQKIIGNIASKTLPKDVALSSIKPYIKYTKISFDASIMPNGDLGIGIYDITNKIKKHKGGKISSHNSLIGEQEALKFTLKYAHDLDVKNLLLFTDNIELARRGVTDEYLENYSFEEVNLTWIPRELNIEADIQSKKGQSMNLININSEVANETKKRVKRKNGFALFSKYNYEQKVNILASLANKNDYNEMNLIDMLKKGTKEDYRWQITNKNLPFVKMAKTILVSDRDCPDYIRSRFKKMKDPVYHKGFASLSFNEFSEEFDKRNKNFIARTKILKEA